MPRQWFTNAPLGRICGPEVTTTVVIWVGGLVAELISNSSWRDRSPSRAVVVIHQGCFWGAKYNTISKHHTNTSLYSSGNFLELQIIKLMHTFESTALSFTLPVDVLTCASINSSSDEAKTYLIATLVHSTHPPLTASDATGSIPLKWKPGLLLSLPRYTQVKSQRQVRDKTIRVRDKLI